MAGCATGTGPLGPSTSTIQAPPTTQAVRDRLREAPAARKFFDPACDHAPRADFDYCTEVDRFDFVLRLVRAGDGLRELVRIEMPACPCCLPIRS